MAQRPANVFFTNPTAAASQANLIRLYDIERQKGEDLNRALATTAQTISARGAARDQLQSQRVAQDRELQTRTSEAEKARQSRDKETDKIISSNEKIAGINATAVGGAARDQAAQEAYKFALAAISSDDPPTDSEFSALVQGLDADRVGRLKGLLATSRRAVDAAAAVGETLAKNWNQRLTKLPPGKTAAQVIDEFDKSGASKQAIFDSATGQFRGARNRARMDSPAVTPPSAVEQLDKIRGRIPGGAKGASTAPVGIIPDAAGAALATTPPFPTASSLSPAPGGAGFGELQAAEAARMAPQAPFPRASEFVGPEMAAPAMMSPVMPPGLPQVMRPQQTDSNRLLRASDLNNPNARIGWDAGNYLPPSAFETQPAYRVTPVDEILRASPQPNAFDAPPRTMTDAERMAVNLNNPNARIGWDAGNYLPPWAFDTRANPAAFDVPQSPTFRIISVDDILKANPMPHMDYLPTDFAPRMRAPALPYLGTDFVPARRLAPPRF